MAKTSMPPKAQNSARAQSLPQGMSGKQMFSRDLDGPQQAQHAPNGDHAMVRASSAMLETESAERLGSNSKATSSGRPSAQSMAQDAMLPKATTGKRMALGLLSKIGAKEKYTKRLARLEAAAAERAARAQHPPAPREEPALRQGLAARLLPKRGTESKLMFGSHRLGVGRQEPRRAACTLQQAPLPEEASAEEEAWHEEPPVELPKYVFAGANPHSCSSKMRSLPPASSIDSDKLLFQSPFGGRNKPPPSPPPPMQLPPPPPPAERPAILSELMDERHTNPFLAMMVEESGGGAQEAPEVGTEDGDQGMSEAASAGFVDDSAEAGDDDGGYSWRDDESVQEIELDPGMGHLIAGSFSSGADTLSVSAAPAPKPPPKPLPGTAELVLCRPGIAAFPLGAGDLQT